MSDKRNWPAKYQNKKNCKSDSEQKFLHNEEVNLTFYVACQLVSFKMFSFVKQIMVHQTVPFMYMDMTESTSVNALRKHNALYVVGVIIHSPEKFL